MKRSSIVAVAVLSMLGFVGVGGQAGAKAAAQNGQIVFSRFDPALGDTITFTANPDGSHLTPLFRYSSGSPHWSPNGTQVAVTSGLGRPCPPTCTGNTVIVDPDTGSYRVLAPQGFPSVSTWCSIWSPDATQFVCDGENDSDPSVNGIYTIRSSDGGGLTRITDAGGMVDIPIDYSPDGAQIVFGRTHFHNCSPRSALYVVNIDGTGLQRITPWGFCDDDGSWSPDGSEIAFVTPNGRLFVVHPDGTGLVKIRLDTATRSFAGDIAWSPDGAKMVFLLTTRTAPHKFREGIATASADGRNIQWVTTSPTFDSQPDWGPHPLAA